MTEINWSNFLNDALINAPDTKIHKGVRTTVHPNESGDWIWHAVLDLSLNYDQKKMAHRIFN